MNYAVELRQLQVEDVTQDYVDWFLDKAVLEYSDNQYRSFTLDGQKRFVKSCLADPNVSLFGVFIGEKHVGNVQLTGLNSLHNRADLSYIVGDCASRGQGIATKAISKVIMVAKKQCGLNKLTAGAAAENVSSHRVLIKNGFLLEGCRKKHLIYNGKYVDQFDFGLVLSG
jgi:[ribosomal protein S5]-alanine N-acetyltransferase